MPGTALRVGMSNLVRDGIIVMTVPIAVIGQTPLEEVRITELRRVYSSSGVFILLVWIVRKLSILLMGSRVGSVCDTAKSLAADAKSLRGFSAGSS